MKPWMTPMKQQPSILKEIERDIPKAVEVTPWFQCIYGQHRAEILHKGTAYCRQHYDEKSRIGELIN